MTPGPNPNGLYLDVVKEKRPCRQLKLYSFHCPEEKCGNLHEKRRQDEPDAVFDPVIRSTETA